MLDRRMPRLRGVVGLFELEDRGESGLRRSVSEEVEVLSSFECRAAEEVAATRDSCGTVPADSDRAVLA